MSRCTMPILCAALIAAAICVAKFSTSSMAIGPWADPIAQRLAFDEFHGDEAQTVLRADLVEWSVRSRRRGRDRACNSLRHRPHRLVEPLRQRWDQHFGRRNMCAFINLQPFRFGH